MKRAALFTAALLAGCAPRTTALTGWRDTEQMVAVFGPPCRVDAATPDEVAAACAELLERGRAVRACEDLVLAARGAEWWTYRARRVGAEHVVAACSDVAAPEYHYLVVNDVPLFLQNDW